MKWRIGGLVVIVILIVAAVVVLVRSGPAPGDKPTPLPPPKATYTLPSAMSTPTHTPASTPRPTPTQNLPTPTQRPPATVAPPTPSPTPVTGTVQPMVDFELSFQLVGSGFTRTVDASLTNIGTIEAHSVKATLQVWSGNSRIKVNGQDVLVEELGNLAAGATVTRSITVGVSFFDGLKLQTNGGTIVVDIVCDEGGKQFRFII